MQITPCLLQVHYINPPPFYLSVELLSMKFKHYISHNETAFTILFANDAHNEMCHIL